MSIKEAKAEVDDAILSPYWEGEHDWLKIWASIDRLILEVRAEMPCSGRYAIWCNDGTAELSDDCITETARVEEHNARVRREGYPRLACKPDPLCPSCAAKVKLKELTAVTT